MSRKKLLKTELSILEKTFPRDGDGCFQIVVASPEELVCRFVDLKKKNKFCLQCNLSVSVADPVFNFFFFFFFFFVYIFFKLKE